MKSIQDLPWIVKAQSYLGLHEGTSLKANKTVLKFFQEAGHAEIKNDHTTPWCAAFVGAILKESGLQNTGSLLALSYSKFGQRLEHPIAGCIATKKRRGGGHVFFVVAFDAKYVYGLGGNQNDQVSIERFPRKAIFSYCWPPGQAIPAGVTQQNVANIKNTKVKET